MRYGFMKPRLEDDLMIELHVEGHDQFGGVTCSCGFTSKSRAEQWRHAADALRADVEHLHRLLNEQP